MDCGRFRFPLLLINRTVTPGGCQLDAIASMGAADIENDAKASLSVPVAATLHPISIAIAIAFSMACSVTEATAQENSTDLAILADQVRSQGFVCDKPVSAERTEAEASATEKVYLLKCKGATYRVHLIPDQAAKIMKVE